MKKYIPFVKLFLLLVVAPIVIYNATLSKTIALYNDYSMAKQNLPKITQRAERRSDSVGNSLIGSGTLISRLASECKENGVSIRNYSPELIGHEGSLNLFSANMQFSGNFIPLVKITDFMEDSLNVKIAESRFSRIKVGKEGKAILLEIKIIHIEEQK